MRDDVIDASGKYVFPGFVDPHVHIYLPFMATFAKDTHATASVAARPKNLPMIPMRARRTFSPLSSFCGTVAAVLGR